MTMTSKDEYHLFKDRMQGKSQHISREGLRIGAWDTEIAFKLLLIRPLYML
jgi:hypothetical protein